MNKEIKNKWINALRSGKYKQCRLRLKTMDCKFCALGVLYDIYLKENNIDWIPYNDRYVVDIDSETKMCRILDNSYQCSITRINDDGKSFYEIADIIEKEL